jgi:hypothetical protein
MDRSKWVARLTGILAIILGIAYLILVQLLDYRGAFEPAPFG